jgi:hypothetical protein
MLIHDFGSFLLSLGFFASPSFLWDALKTPGETGAVRNEYCPSEEQKIIDIVHLLITRKLDKFFDELFNEKTIVIDIVSLIEPSDDLRVETKNLLLKNIDLIKSFKLDNYEIRVEFYHYADYKFNPERNFSKTLYFNNYKSKIENGILVAWYENRSRY